MALELKRNRGDREFGSPKQCFRKGYALGFNQEVKDVDQFIQKWTAEYKPYIVQHIDYGSNGSVTPGYQQATLVQHMQRGYALGSKARAEREMRSRHDDFTPNDHNVNTQSNTHRYHEVQKETSSQKHEHTQAASSHSAPSRSRAASS